ncbi:sigma 54 modulation/S30EA ribosomal C-terminal domain-containing protein [Mycobacterium sp.]|uniref:sigma 54 modulation/S30EA ribosomal C-terminal domain-containing protein n=1 Tax=Mycobacterium sp. TaxID=1785 RepID=UPI00126EBC4A|nr:sigma 54 modulation/S30EA ribosomal C-terminal domain-containing protein [Mycobacterium sp.]KAA8958764.1 MAG: hypothetical protein F6Q13_15200 [Mycobacterium sp.]
MTKVGLPVVFAEPTTVREFPDVIVFSGGRLAASHAERAARAVGRVLEHQGITGGARVRLAPANCARGPMLVQVNLRVRATPTRVQAVTRGRDDLSSALARLDRQIVRVRAAWRPRPWPDRTRLMLTAPADAVITRRKPVRLLRGSPAQAVVEMDAMDYDVHLFTDAETGEDAVVYRAGPSGLRLARQRRMCPPGWSCLPPTGCVQPVSLVVNSRPTPMFAEDAAVMRLRAHGLRFLFFTNPATGRGQLLYPRYDGNLGLVTPVDDPSRDDV